MTSRKLQRAMAFVSRQPEPAGWPGDVRIIGLRFDPRGITYNWPDRPSYPRDRRRERQHLPLIQVPLGRLVAVQPTVDRALVLQLLRAGTWEEPILVLRHGRMFWIQDGHHRAYVARLLGQRSILAYLRPPPL